MNCCNERAEYTKLSMEEGVSDSQGHGCDSFVLLVPWFLNLLHRSVYSFTDCAPCELAEEHILHSQSSGYRQGQLESEFIRVRVGVRVRVTIRVKLRQGRGGVVLVATRVRLRLRLEGAVGSAMTTLDKKA